MTEQIDVFATEQKFEINGHNLVVKLATFVESERLFTAVMNCYQQGIEGVGLLSKEEVKLALIPCLKKSFFDNEPLSLEFFEKIENRKYYLGICMKVLEANTEPFMANPS